MLAQSVCVCVSEHSNMFQIIGMESLYISEAVSESRIVFFLVFFLGS